MSVAPAASALSARFSHRSVVTIGGLMCSLGVIMGSLARNVVDLYLTVGLLNGTCDNRERKKKIKSEELDMPSECGLDPMLISDIGPVSVEKMHFY